MVGLKVHSNLKLHQATTRNQAERMRAAWFKMEQTDGRTWSYNSRRSCPTDKERDSGKSGEDL